MGFTFKILGHFLLNKSNYLHSNSIYLTQKINENNKISHNDGCILEKKTINFTNKETKKSCAIRETIAKFFATIVNWYKYLLTKVSYNKSNTIFY